MCCLTDIENEFHFVFCCPFYWELCNTLFGKIKTNIDFVNLDEKGESSVFKKTETMSLKCSIMKISLSSSIYY